MLDEKRGEESLSTSTSRSNVSTSHPPPPQCLSNDIRPLMRFILNRICLDFFNHYFDDLPVVHFKSSGYFDYPGGIIPA